MKFNVFMFDFQMVCRQEANQSNLKRRFLALSFKANVLIWGILGCFLLVWGVLGREKSQGNVGACSLFILCQVQEH